MNRKGPECWRLLPHTVMTPIPLWLYQYRGYQNRRGRKEALGTIDCTQRPPLPTLYQRQPRSSGFQDARRIRVPCSPCLLRFQLRIHLSTPAFRREGPPVPVPQALLAVNPLPELHHLLLFATHSLLGLPIVHSLPPYRRHLMHLMNRLVEIPVHLHPLAAPHLSWRSQYGSVREDVPRPKGL